MAKSPIHRIDRSYYRSKLFLQDKPESIDPTYGTPVNTWVNMKNPDGSPQWCLGFVDYRVGKEIEEARRIVPTVNVRIKIQFNPTVTPRQRLVNAKTGEVYEIASINNVYDQDVEMIILATATPKSEPATT